MLDVCLVGTGGMMPLPRRWLTALMTRYNGSSLLIDCGEGTQVAIKEKGWSFKPIDVICFTHYHGDHISGLPGLLLTMGNADRTEPLTLVGPKGLERVVNALRVIAPELPFEIKFIEITQPEQVIELNGYRITAFKVNHNVLCYGYTLEILRQGKFSAERAKEQDIPLKYWNPLQKGQTIEAVLPIHRRWYLDLREKESGLLIQQIPGQQNLSCEMQRNRICLSVKECTEKMTKQTKHADTSI